MAKRNAIDGETLNLDFSDLIYRSNLLIMENEAFGNQGAKFDVIEYMDRILAPFRDPQYKQDMDNIGKMKAPEGSTPQAISIAERAHSTKIMNKKHEALMCLAYRNGFLGNKKAAKHTGIDHTIEAEDEQVI